MSVQVKSLINVAQTIDSVALPAYATQLRARSTTALVAAAAAKTVQVDPVDAEGGVTILTYVPVTTDVIDLPNDVELAVVDPAGTIAALTLRLPVAPYDGQRVQLYFDEIVTALTMEDGTGVTHTLKGALTAGTAAGFATYQFSKAALTWYRVA